MRRLFSMTSVAVMAAVSLPLAAAPQSSTDHERAMIQYRLGEENMRAEQFPAAAKAFQQAIDIEPSFDMAYYGLGKANMAMKKYIDAIGAYTKCRDIVRGEAGRQFSNQQEAQRHRNDKMMEYDETLRHLRTLTQTMQTQDQIRMIENAKRDLQNSIQRGQNISVNTTIPPWISLALGSAYFRAEKFADAEREYKAAIEADPKVGEAHQNLAVVYMQTGRIDEAEKSIAAAKKAGFRVNPQLEQEIKDRKRRS